MLYVGNGVWLPLKSHLFRCFVGFGRSGKGAIHIWNLNTRRAKKVLDGHAGSSITWVSTLQSAEALIRWGCFNSVTSLSVSMFNNRVLQYVSK